MKNIDWELVFFGVAFVLVFVILALIGHYAPEWQGIIYRSLGK